ncbi:MAG: type 4a pilus biogenesis protein PilO [Thermoleophilia bacterium]|nr:type 4a pilus biogenesis protein PilO [Thermoleophilia bacterium]
MRTLLDSPKGRIGAVVVGGLLIMAAAWFLLISPQKSTAAELETQVSASRAELSQRRLALARPSASVNVKPSDLYLLTKALPNDPGMSEILLDVNRLAARNALDFRSIAPSAPVLGTGYLQQPLDVAVQGRFGDISRFLGDLRALVTVRNKRLDARGRLYSVTRVEMKEPENLKKFPIVKAEVTLNAYSFSAPVPPPAPDPSTTPAGSAQSGTVAAGVTP